MFGIHPRQEKCGFGIAILTKPPLIHEAAGLIKTY